MGTRTLTRLASRVGTDIGLGDGLSWLVWETGRRIRGSQWIVYSVLPLPSVLGAKMRFNIFQSYGVIGRILQLALSDVQYRRCEGDDNIFYVATSRLASAACGSDLLINRKIFHTNKFVFIPGDSG